MGLLTRDAILAVDERASARVPTPEWGGDVRVLELDGRDREAFLVWLAKSGDRPEVKARLAVLTVVDEEGHRLFTEADVAALNATSGVALERVFRAAWALNKLGTDAIEDLAKNSEPGPRAAI